MILNRNNKIFTTQNRVLSTPWKPSEIGNLSFWLDSSFKFLTLNNNNVINWMDKSGNLFNFSQNNITIAPTYTQNGIYFNGNSVISSNLLYSGIFTIFTVFKSNNNGYVYHYSNNANSETGFFMNTSSNSIAVTNGGLINASIKSAGSNWSSDNNLRIVCQSYNGYHTGHTLYINNLEYPSSTYLSYNQSPGILNVNKSFNLGGLYSGNSGINGYVLEILYFNSVLSVDDINKVNDYLNSKYSIY